MKMIRMTAIGMAFAGLLSVGLALAAVATTPHNLSSSGTYTIKTTATNQICVFCHTPHGAVDPDGTGVPLWNRKTDATGFEMYVFARTDAQLAPRQHMTIASAPQGASLACLSCHDGTIAFDQLYNGPTSAQGVYNYDATGVSKGWSFTGGNRLTTGGAAIGKDLKNDHPISVTYDSSKGYRNGGYFPLATAKTNGAKFYGSGGDQMECGSCHDPHSEAFPPFLVKDNASSNLCAMCHA